MNQNIFSEKLLDIPFWFWQFIVFPVVIFSFSLFVNIVRDKLKAFKKFKLLREYTIVWLEKIVEAANAYKNYYLKLSYIFTDYNDQEVIQNKYSINCDKILSIDKEDLISLFIKKIIFPLEVGEVDFNENESRNFVALVENLQSILFLEKSASIHCDYSFDLIEKFNLDLNEQYLKCCRSINDFKRNIKKPHAGQITQEYITSIDTIFNNSFGQEEFKLIGNRRITNQFMNPIRKLSEEYLRKVPMDLQVPKIIDDCFEFERLYLILIDKLKYDSIIFKDFHHQINEKTVYIEKYLTRYSKSKIKSFWRF